MTIELGNETTSNGTKETRTESHKWNGEKESNDGKNRHKTKEENEMSNHDSGEKKQSEGTNTNNNDEEGSK
eukprot:6870099-Ditylum_brightwellii.AAC.1